MNNMTGIRPFSKMGAWGVAVAAACAGTQIWAADITVGANSNYFADWTFIELLAPRAFSIYTLTYPEEAK